MSKLIESGMLDFFTKVMSLKEYILSSEDEKKIDAVFEKIKSEHAHLKDPWGFDLDTAKTTLKLTYPLYKHYFKVRVFNKENINPNPYMVISNHTGQIAIDGILISIAFAMEMNEPLVLRAMVERFLIGLPFIGEWVQKGGAVLGDRQNCQHLLNSNQSVLVFPEGVKGIAKSTNEFYKLQRFTRGFFRIALQTKTPILPIAVIGAEEFYPLVYQARGIAKTLGLPALPITPLWLPLPSPVDIYIGKEYIVPSELSPDSPDHIIDSHINAIQKEIKLMTIEGLKKRRKFWGSVTGRKNS